MSILNSKQEKYEIWYYMLDMSHCNTECTAWARGIYELISAAEALPGLKNSPKGASHKPVRNTSRFHPKSKQTDQNRLYLKYDILCTDLMLKVYSIYLLKCSKKIYHYK